MTLKPEEWAVHGGWPSITLAKRPAVALAAPAPPATLTDKREILSLRQAAQVLGMALDDASRVLSLGTVSRAVGFDARDCHRLAVELSRDPALRRELGVDPVKASP